MLWKMQKSDMRFITCLNQVRFALRVFWVLLGNQFILYDGSEQVFYSARGMQHVSMFSAHATTLGICRYVCNNLSKNVTQGMGHLAHLPKSRSPSTREWVSRASECGPRQMLNRCIGSACDP